MIFRPELAKQIKQEKKTQTRRLIIPGKRFRYVTGRSYAIQPGRGQKSIGRLTITGIGSEPLGDLTLKDAKREGFGTTDEFFDYWQMLHGRVDRDKWVWVISFRLGDWTDTPRLLAATPGAPHGDYVSNPHLALRDEQEAVSEQEQDTYSALAHARDRNRGKAGLVTERDRIAESLVQMRAHLAIEPDRDVSKTVRALEHQLASLDRKLRAA